MESSMEAAPTESKNAATQESPSPFTQHENNDNDDVSLSQQEINTALQEAQNVMDSEGYERLEGFNLLGVVANPRGSSGFSHGHVSPPHVRVSPSRTTTTTNTTVETSLSSSSFHTLESTLAHVTEQIDMLNSMLDQWSIQYLGSYSAFGWSSEENVSSLDYQAPDQVESQKTELPMEFSSLELKSVQDYLESSGYMAHAFCSNTATTTTTSLNQDVVDEQDKDQDLWFLQELEQSVPEAFFTSDFDLTNPKTFCELLVLPQTDVEQPNVHSNKQDCLTIPTETLLALPPPDSFTRDLDQVEVALLHQVRSKSVEFFHETNRFGQLKDWIASLVKDVHELRAVLEQTTRNSVVAWDLIPTLDKKRNDLTSVLQVLESAMEISRTKSSIGGLLSAQDDLSAAEQIQYARQLLLKPQESFCLSKLASLGTVQHQLDQYQSLVVANLSEQVVEIFLHWKFSPQLHLANGSLPNLPRTIAETRQVVRDVMAALTTCTSLTKTGRLYQERLSHAMNIAVRTTVEQFAHEATSHQEESMTTLVSTISFESFMDCLDLLFEQLLQQLKSAVGVNNFCRQEGFTLKDEEQEQVGTSSAETSTTDDNNGETLPPPPVSSPSATSGRVMTATAEAVVAAAELSSKSISELLRLRKEVHSLVSLEEMKRLWDLSLNFTIQLEKASGQKAYGLRSTLLAQAKAFVERKHESNMSGLVAALDSERWTQCNVSAERQASLTRLCSGRAVLVTSTTKRTEESKTDAAALPKDKVADAQVEGLRYKVVWSCLLLVEMLMQNVASAACFQALATNVVGKVSELLRLFNSRATQLVLGAGAIQSAARLKSINAKHLSLVTQCLGLVMAILPHVRAALMAQLPPKQHTLLVDLDKIKKEYMQHNEKVLNKFVTIIGGIVEHGLAPRIANTDFDARAATTATSSTETDDHGDVHVPCCVFVEGVFTNTKKMHRVLSSLLQEEHLQDVFSRIFAYLDQKIPTLFVTASVPKKQQSNGGASSNASFSFPSTNSGKRQMLLEVESMTVRLNQLAGVRPWEFTAITVLERKMDFEFQPLSTPEPQIEEKSPIAQQVSEESADQPSEEESQTITQQVSEESADQASLPEQQQVQHKAIESTEATVQAENEQESTPVETSNGDAVVVNGEANGAPADHKSNEEAAEESSRLQEPPEKNNSDAPVENDETKNIPAPEKDASDQDDNTEMPSTEEETATNPSDSAAKGRDENEDSTMAEF